MKEAGRSSLLSNRWRNLWNYTSHLNFDQLLEESMRAPQSQLSSAGKKALRTKYVTWVNQVLGSHERYSLEEFIVHFDLDATFSKDIDEWIKFIISKGAKRIVIDFTRYIGSNFYSLSHECNNLFKSVSNLSNISCLRSLTLGKVKVDGELIEYLLSKCPHLESLSVAWSDKLFSLKVAGPSLPLKYLKILGCDLLQSVELCASSLVTFFYNGNPINFVLGSNPLLSELCMEGGCNENVVASCLPQFSSHFSQIETLSLASLFQVGLQPPTISVLRNLKHIVWRITFFYDKSLMGVTEFIMAAPCLQKLTLQLTVVTPLERSPIEKHTVELHDGLKEVEICGYAGGWSHLELARYLIRSAINLEKMVIEPSRRPEEKREKASKLLAKQSKELKGSLPTTAELIIL